MVVGVVCVVGAASYGWISLHAIGDTLHAKPFGQTITFTPSGSHRAVIFTTQPLPEGRTAACRVTTDHGTAVHLKAATPYRRNSGRRMETTSGFDLTSDTTYSVTCRASSAVGEFAVVEVSNLPRVVGFGGGLLGGLLFIAGLISYFVARRRNHDNGASVEPATHALTVPPDQPRALGSRDHLDAPA